MPVSCLAFHECDRFSRVESQATAEELTKTQYHTVRPSMPSPFVQMAIVKAQAMKMINAWVKWIMFFVLPKLPPDSRGIRMLEVFRRLQGWDQPFGRSRGIKYQGRQECTIDRELRRRECRTKYGRRHTLVECVGGRLGDAHFSWLRRQPRWGGEA